ncbi:MAG: cadherin-like beta sandwich domain-containing protein [Adhaeribacter sp.]
MAVDGYGDVNILIQRKDGKKFSFYGAWLKYSNLAGYAIRNLSVSYTGSTEPQGNYGENTTVTLSKNVNVTSVSLMFRGLNTLILDNLVVGPATITLPVLTTNAASAISGTSANVSGNVTSDGEATITERGIVWSTTANPTTANNKVTAAGTTGSFTSTLTGLSVSTTYYARAFATNSAGTAYGTQVSFTTTDGTGPVTLNPTMDTSIDPYGGYPTDPSLYIGYEPDYGHAKAALKFQLPALSGAIQSAKLRLNVGFFYPGPGTFVKAWSSNDDTWQENITTIPVTSQELNQVSVAQTGWVEIDVTSFVASQYAGDKVVSLVLTGNTSTSVASSVYLNSSESGSNKPELVITTGITLSSNANLSALTLSAGTLSPAFAAGTTSYTAAVASGVSGITVTPTRADANATIKVKGVAVASGSASALIPLSVGSNTIDVEVTAQDGSTKKTYTLTVSRPAATLPANELSFNGTNQYVAIPNKSALEFATGTVEMWVRPTWTPGTHGGSSPALLSMRSTSGTRYSLHIGNGLDQIGIWNGNTYLFVNYNFVKGQWYHIAAVMKAASTDFYVNGTLAGSTANTLNAAVTGYELKIGASELGTALGTNERFEGAIDEVRVWNTIRTAAEIQNNFSDPVSASSPGLVAYYPIAAGVTGAANALERKLSDQTANAFHGTLYNYYSSNANLSALTLSAGTLSPAFAAGTTSYTASVPNTTSSVNVTATLADSKASLKVNGTAVTSGSAASVPLAVGSNTITVLATAEDGTTKTYTLAITRAVPAIVLTQSQVNVSCNGGSNGTAAVSATGGTAPYTYSWSPSGGTGAMATGLAAGNYTVTVTDANGQTATGNYAITQPTALTASITAQTNLACNGGSTGSATVSVSGGSPGYTYSWSPSGGTGATATGLSAGTYTVTVTDANSCTTTKSVTITQPASALTASISAQTNVACNGASTGSATVSVSGGTPGYTYSWSPSGGTAATASGLSAGNYTVTVTDANGCTTAKSVTIIQPTALTAFISAQTNVACNGASTGSATVLASGGTPGYTYSWSPSGGTAATATGLSAGTYTVTVTDANACTTTRSVAITQPTALTATATKTDATTLGGSDGSASVSVLGGTPGYTYSWSPSGGTAATATGLAAGSYTVIITDANACTITRTVTVGQPSAAQVLSFNRPAGSPTNAATVYFTLGFSQPVTGLSAANFQLSSTGLIGASITGFSPVDAATYQVAVSTGTGNGELGLSLINDENLSLPLGNLPFAATGTYIVDKQAPAAPVISGISSDTGRNPADGITSDNTLTITGTAEAGSTVELSVAGTMSGTTAADNSGNWSYVHPTSLAEGSYALTATARDLAGNTSAASTAFQALIDRSGPVIAGHSYPASGTYVNDDYLAFSFSFSEPVWVTGTPSLAITLETGTAAATYLSGSGTNTLSFRYQVANGEKDDNGIVLGTSFTLAGATLQDAAGNTAAAVLPVVGTSEIKIDGTAPAVAAVLVPANATYKEGDQLDFTVNFSKAVTLSGGTPQLPLVIGVQNREAAYLSGSGTNILSFRYTVQAGDLDADGISLGAALLANGATLQDVNGNPASLSLNAVAATAGVLIDGQRPGVASLTRETPSATHTRASTVVYRLSFSEAVTGVDLSDFALSLTGTAAGTLASLSQSSSQAWLVTINGVSGDGELQLVLNNSGTGIADAAGNALEGGFATGETFTIDNTAPVITGVTDGAYYNREVTISFNEGTGMMSGLEVFSGQKLQAEDRYTLVVTDAAGNSSTVSFDLDLTAPTGTLVINGGAAITNATAVNLAITTQDNISTDFMRFSTDRTNWSDWEAAGTAKAFTLPAGEGLKTVYLQLRDVAGNISEAAIQDDILLDQQEPAVAVSGPAADSVNAAFQVNITFNEEVSGFEKEEILVINGEVTGFTRLNAREYAAEILPAAEGPVSVQVAAGKARDAAANANTASNTLSREFDVTVPSLTLTATPAAQQTNAPFTLAFAFTEAVSGFEANDIQVVNAGVSDFTKVNSREYTALISPVAQGAVSVSVAAGSVQDPAGNGNTASSTVSKIFDSLAPAGYAVAFNQAQIDFVSQTAASVKVSGAEAGTTYFYAIASANGGTPVSGTAPVASAGFDISALNLSGLNDGELTLRFYLQDAAGNKGADAVARVMKYTLNIMAFTLPATRNVPIRTTFAQAGLPAAVEVTYSDNTKQSLAVSWQPGAYNGAIAGTYELSGVLTLVPGTTNLDGVQPKMTVVVEPNKVPTALTLSQASFRPEIAPDEAIGAFATTDADDNQHVYTLVSGAGSSDNALFEIIGNQLFLLSNKGLSGKTSFAVRVRSTDPYDNSIEQTFALSKQAYAKPIPELKIVNAFSPNGDGINDTWIIPELKFYNDVEVEIFDRSGQRLFRSTNPELGWDGRADNGLALKGAVLYVVRINDINLVKKGVVTILRK